MQIPLVCLALLCLVRPLAAQGPRSTTFETAPPPSISGRAATGTSISLAWPLDSVPHRRSYWLEGGLIGGALFGLVGTQFCGMGSSHRDLGCYVPAFTFVGGVVGFPIGALVGRLFPKG